MQEIAAAILIVKRLHDAMLKDSHTYLYSCAVLKSLYKNVFSNRIHQRPGPFLILINIIEKQVYKGNIIFVYFTVFLPYPELCHFISLLHSTRSPTGPFTILEP